MDRNRYAISDLSSRNDQEALEVTGVTLDHSLVSNEVLKAALNTCAESLKSQFGDHFNEEDFSVGISDELYEYDPSENMFSSDSESGNDSEEF